MSDNHFKQFTKEMTEILRDNSDKSSLDQKELLEQLFELEDKFRKALLSTTAGKDMYPEFMRYIKDDKGNILSARVYFRERQETFSANISQAFQNNKPNVLHKFKINYLFAKWVCDRYNGPKKKTLQNIFDKIVSVRKLLCENNLPLAINRAKIFWSKIPNSDLEYMDIIQNASEGLINAIDKFVPPYKTVFRSVAIGRMSLNMLTDHNATLVKFSPKDRRILYRSNNAKVKEGLTDIDDVLRYVQDSFPDVTKERLENIMNAAVYAVRAKRVGDDEEDVVVSMESHEVSAETKFVNKDLLSKVQESVESLPIIQMKVLRLKTGFLE